MVGLGLNKILFIKDKQPICLTLSNISTTGAIKKAVWSNNYMFDKNKKGEPHKHWINIQNDPNKINDIIKAMGEKLKIIKIDMFLFNNNVIKVNELYPGHKNYYSMFKIDSDIWKLCILGSKTVNELVTIGTNKRKESFVPLIMSNNSSSFKILNHS